MNNTPIKAGIEARNAVCPHCHAKDSFGLFKEGRVSPTVVWCNRGHITTYDIITVNEIQVDYVSTGMIQVVATIT